MGDENLWSGAVCLTDIAGGRTVASDLRITLPVAKSHRNAPESSVAARVRRSICVSSWALAESGRRESNPRSQLGKAHLGIRRDLLKSRKVHLKAISHRPAAITYYALFVVACCTKWARDDVLHAVARRGNRGSQPMSADNENRGFKGSSGTKNVSLL